jgi:putative phosphoesterase
LRVIVFSDSHGELANALQALKEAGPVDLVIHAGDFYRDAFNLAAEIKVPTRAVLGNCDPYGEGPLELLLELSGKKILLVHGHAFGYENRNAKLLARAKATGADAVVFGHSHRAEITGEDGILLFNPGSISKPRDTGGPSYGILEIDKEGIKPAIYRLKDKTQNL